jgi:hypothetical protein
VPAEKSLLQPFLLHDSYLEEEQLNAFLMESNPEFAYSDPHYISAVPQALKLNAAMTCSPASSADTMANEGQLQLNISGVCPLSLPHPPPHEESLSSVIDKSSVSTNGSTGDSVETSSTADSDVVVECVNEGREMYLKWLTASDDIYRYVSFCAVEGTSYNVNNVFSNSYT